MDSIYFSPAADAFRMRTRQFLRERIAPHLEEWESERRIPRDTWKLFADEGLLGLHYPSAYEGRELPFCHSIAYLEELGRLGHGGFRAAMSVHSYMATTYLQLAGSHHQKLSYLKPAIQGDMIAALAITEPQSGSDVSGIRCEARAMSTGDRYAIRGSKAFVTNGLNADFIVTAVRMSDSLPVRGRRPSAGGDEDPSREGWLALLGYRERALRRRRGRGRPASRPEEHRVLLDHESVSARADRGGPPGARGDRLRARSVPTVRERASGVRQANHRAPGDTEAARQLTYHAAWLHSQGKLAVSECAMAKLRATELAVEVAGQCLQIFGGHGYLAEAPISRVFRDTRLGTIAGGTSEIMREIIAETEL
jgi:acyl-CoA dehydrogenase